jgi:hypothetical protein
VIDKLTALGRPLTVVDFEAASNGTLTMEQVLGEVPLLAVADVDDASAVTEPEQHKNPALRHLWQQVRGTSFCSNHLSELSHPGLSFCFFPSSVSTGVEPGLALVECS